MEIKSKRNWQSLQNYFKTLDSVIIAFSGGVDSALLAYAANFVLQEKALAVIAVSASLAILERDSAVKFLHKYKIAYKIVETNELSQKNYRQNSTERCYYCKFELYSKIIETARASGINNIIDGSNTNDLKGHRPGYKALEKLKILTPYLDLNFTKEDIRDLAHYLDLPVWDKAENACLASRIPTGIEITKERLKQIEQCEAFLVGLDFKIYRVRYHESLARIELDEVGLQRLLSDKILRVKIDNYFREQGFSFVNVDLREFQSGSLSKL